MSGGERVWINECLVRAVARYLAQNTVRRYDTRFSDETDGPLDTERKRMFMAMKRRVLGTRWLRARVLRVADAGADGDGGCNDRSGGDGRSGGERAMSLGGRHPICGA